MMAGSSVLSALGKPFWSVFLEQESLILGLLMVPDCGSCTAFLYGFFGVVFCPSGKVTAFVHCDRVP